MERNTNENIIVLDINMFNELMNMANNSERYSTSRIHRHARKFNPFLQGPHQERVRNFEINRTRNIQATRAYVEANCGKERYAKIDTTNLIAGKSDEDVYTLVKVKGYFKNRCFVAVNKVNSTYVSSQVSPVSADTLISELPEGYVRAAGKFSDLFVKEGGAYDNREAYKEQMHRELAETLRANHPDDPNALCDVKA